MRAALRAIRSRPVTSVAGPSCRRSNSRRKARDSCRNSLPREKRIEFFERQPAEIGADKALIDTPTRPAAGIPADYKEYMRLMMYLMVLEFRSGATRVLTFMVDHGQSTRYFDFIPQMGGT